MPSSSKGLLDGRIPMLFSTVTNDLVFEYNTTHKVLICHKCRYAVQKNALSSHLLRHKVYRGERQRLLAQFSGLDLLEPEDIGFPSPDSSPIPGLPVIPGLRCFASPACGHLCASEKRMRRHWAEHHSPHESNTTRFTSAVGSLARPAQLQTFYRGTRIKYFEVTPIDRSNVQRCTPESNRNDPPQPIQADNDPDPSSLPPNHALDASVTNPTRSVSDLINLETLAYFHHYTTKTCITLPLTNCDDRDSLSAGYWATEVVQCCLRESALTSGLLAISAYHLVTSISDPRETTIHSRTYELYAAEFDNKWARTYSDQSLAPARDEVRYLDVGRRISNVLDCISCQVRGGTRVPAGSKTAEFLCRLLRSIQYLTNRRVDLSVLAEGDCDHAPWQPTVNFQGSQAAQEQQATWPDEQQEIEMSDARYTPKSYLTLIRSLPYRLADIYGKPTDMRAFLVHLTAMRSLIQLAEGTAKLHRSEDFLVAAISWIDTGSDPLFNMIREEDAPTLLILAGWAVSGIGAAAKQGCWYLDGVAKHILSLVECSVPDENPKIQKLLQDIGSSLENDSGFMQNDTG